MRVLVSGVGAVGARAARYLVADGATEQVLVHDTDRKRRDAVVRSLGERAQPIDEPDPDAADLVLLASPAARQAAVARAAVAAGRHVVSVGDSIPLVEQLLDLDAEARERGVVVAAGAGFGPGLSCVLARHAAAELDAVDEIHVAHHGTGGPACARQHHRALRHTGLDWRDHTWRRRPPGSGRELCFFPDPIGGADCYRAALPDALLLVPAFPTVSRVTARLAATRERIVRAALSLVARGGYGATAMPAIAAEAGVSTGLLYRYFPSKADLFDEVFRRASQREIDACAATAALPGSARERLARVVETFARRALKGRRLAWALLAEPVDPVVDADRAR
ncbi:MAG: TetR family transcriptional regulator, partial [Acidimicrobiia bacterium]